MTCIYHARACVCPLCPVWNYEQETKTELLRERKKHEQIISELERKTVQGKERLRKEMEAKIQEAQEAFTKLTE